MSNNMSTIVRRSSRQSARSGSEAGPPEPAVDLGLLRDLIGYHVRLAQMAIFADFDRALGDLQLSPGLFGLLVVIEANPGLRQSQLAEAARLDRSTLVPALDKLEARGLVERRPAPDDRRSNGLFLNTAGHDALQAAKRAVREHERRIARDLSSAERTQLIDLLQRIIGDGA